MSRNYHDLVRIENLMDKSGFQIHFYQSGTNLNDKASSSDRFMLGIELAVAKHGSDKQLAKLEKRTGKLLELFTDGELNQTSLRRKMGELETQSEHTRETRLRSRRSDKKHKRNRR